MCYRDFIQEVKIELLKEELLNNPPQTQKKYLSWQQKGKYYEIIEVSHLHNGVFLYFAKNQNPERHSYQLYHPM